MDGGEEHRGREVRRPLQGCGRLFIPPCPHQRHAELHDQQRRQRVELHGALGVRDPLLQPAFDEHQIIGQPLPRGDVARIQLDRAPQVSRRPRPVPVADEAQRSRGAVDLREVGRQIEGFLNGRACPGSEHIGRREPVLREHRAGIREARVSQRVLRIERQRLIEALERLLEPEPALRQVIPPFQIEMIGVEIPGGRSDQRRPLDTQGDLKSVGDRLRDLVLDREDVRHFAVVALRPEMVAVADLHELGTDPQPISRLAHASLQHRRDLELRADLGEVDRRAAERE